MLLYRCVEALHGQVVAECGEEAVAGFELHDCYALYTPTDFDNCQCVQHHCMAVPCTAVPQ